MFFDMLRRKKALGQAKRLEEEHVPTQEEFLAEVHAASEREQRLRSLLVDIRRIKAGAPPLRKAPARAKTTPLRPKKARKTFRSSRKRKSPSRK